MGIIAVKINRAIRVSINSIIVNIILSALKFIAGIVANSGAMISDAVHSASDVFSTLIVIAGINISNRKSDKNHQYGHERIECVAAIILAAILILTGIGIGINGITKIMDGSKAEIAIPGMLAMVAAVISIIVKEWMYWYTRRAAKALNSPSLMADAWHHRSDAMSSIGSLIGIAGARMGILILEPIASIAICIMIIKSAYDICRDAFYKLVDRSCNDETYDGIAQTALGIGGVKGIDMLKTRQFGAKFYVDIEISVEGEQTLHSAHSIAHSVHDAIEKKYDNAKHVMVHMNPF